MGTSAPQACLTVQQSLGVAGFIGYCGRQRTELPSKDGTNARCSIRRSTENEPHTLCAERAKLVSSAAYSAQASADQRSCHAPSVRYSSAHWIQITSYLREPIHLTSSKWCAWPATAPQHASGGQHPPGLWELHVLEPHLEETHSTPNS